MAVPTFVEDKDLTDANIDALLARMPNFTDVTHTPQNTIGNSARVIVNPNGEMMGFSSLGSIRQYLVLQSLIRNAVV